MRNRVFLSANLSLVLSFLALFAVSFLMPFYLVQLRGFHTMTAGLLLTPLPLTLAVVAPISGRVADRTGSTRFLAAVGLLIACVGLVLLGTLRAESTVGEIVWRLLVIGFGQALFQAPNNSALIGSVAPSDRGSAAGFLATGRVVGQSTSVALAGAVFAGLGGAAAGAALQRAAGGAQAAAGAALQAAAGSVAAMQQTFLLGFRAAMLTCAGVAVVGVLASLVRGRGELAGR